MIGLSSSRADRAEGRAEAPAFGEPVTVEAATLLIVYGDLDVLWEITDGASHQDVSTA